MPQWWAGEISTNEVINSLGGLVDFLLGTDDPTSASQVAGSSTTPQATTSNSHPTQTTPPVDPERNDSNRPTFNER